MKLRNFLRKLLACLFGTVYTKGEVIHLVNVFLEDVRLGRLDIDSLRGAKERDRWCIHLSVAFEKYCYIHERFHQADSVLMGEEHSIEK